MEPKKHNFPYKYRAFANVNAEIIKRYHKLKAVNYKDRLLLDKPYILRGMEKLKPEDLLYEGHYTLLLTKDSDYDDFNILSDLFNESCRMRCILTGRPMSPYDYYQKNYYKIKSYALKKYKVINHHTLRESIYELFFNGKGECTNHRPNNIVMLMQMFDAKKILDPSAGWGDRLIGALAGGCTMYVGIDPNECVHKGYQKIINFFKATDRTKMYLSGFENFTNPDNIVFDMVYTSPPYFTMEVYESGENQSITQYPTEDVWFEHFLKILLNKAIEYTKKGGIIAINIGMVGGNTYVYDMIEYMNNNKKKYVDYLGIISYSDPALRSVNPIFIWKTK
jgi:16S rRNA G966 N2-methylase RsmD